MMVMYMSSFFTNHFERAFHPIPPYFSSSSPRGNSLTKREGRMCIMPPPFTLRIYGAPK